MESTVIFRAKQEVQSADNNNLQEFARNSIDHIVKDAIDPGKGYTGFTASKTAAAEVTLDNGRLYAGGAVYARDENVVIDLFNALPLVTKKRVAIVAWGQEVETDVQPRDFLIDAQTRTTEPQSVSMENHRHAELSTVAGVEGPDPSYPATDANVTVIAYVLLDTAGVVSIEQWTPTQIPNLRDVSDRTAVLEAWRGQISGQVDTLRTDLSAMSDRLGLFATKAELAALIDIVDGMREDLYEPDAFVWYGTNHFLDGTGSQTGHGDYDAVVNEGIRFPEDGASSPAALALLDPNNVFVKAENGFVLPAYSHSMRMDLTGYTGETRVAQYTYETSDVVLLSRSRTRRRYGPTRTVCSNSSWWSSGTYDQVTNVFTKDGETFEVVSVNDQRGHSYRVTQFWLDTYEEPYWDKVTTTSSISGQQAAQTFLNSQDGWLSQVGLYFSRKAASGDVTVVICETKYGMPDISRAISKTTLPVDDIEVGSISDGAGLPSLIETKVPIIPTYLKAGKRYAVVLITAGDHYVAMTDADNHVVNGTFFVSTDGAFYAGNLVDDMKMRLYYAQFDRSRLSVELTSLQLAGGILDIDIINDGVIPPACRADFEVQISGAWVPFDASPDGPDLTGLPALLPLRATLTGTRDLMPGFGLTGSQAIVSRPKTAFTWVSDARSVGSTAASIRVVVNLQSFNETDHDCTVSLLTGVALDGTEAADTVTDVTLADGTIRRTVDFTGLSVDDYAVKIVGSTVSAADLFHVSELVEYAQT